MTNPKHTDTSRSDDLVERLEEWEWTLRAVYKGGDLGTDEPALLMGEAADRIEALEAEIEWLRARLAHAEDDCEDDCIYCEERRQEIARARAALGEKQ